MKSERRLGSVLSVALLIFAIPVVASLVGWNFNPKKKTHLEKVVTVEAFADEDGDSTSMPDVSQPSTSFCSHHKTDPESLETACNDFESKKACLSVNCCGWLAHRMSDDHVNVGCVAANENGRPVFKSDVNGKRLDAMSFETRVGNSAAEAKAKMLADERAMAAGMHKDMSSAKEEVEKLWKNI